MSRSAERLIRGLRARGVKLPETLCGVISRDQQMVVLNAKSGNAAPTWYLCWETLSPRYPLFSVPWEYEGAKGDRICGFVLTKLLRRPPEAWFFEFCDVGRVRESVYASPGELRVHFNG